MSADRNLLLGLVALQNNFVDRHQLVAAFDRWVSDKASDLGKQLVKAQAITTEELSMIEGLVERHLRKHAGNAQASLAAFRVADPIAVDLQELPDRELHASLGHLPRMEQKSAELSPESIVTLTRYHAAPAAGRFRILRPHAQGGLGEVLIAQDQELHREVALKRMHHGLADDLPSRARFVVEAEVTAALEHPGIVPVYGLGSSDDGRPYYAMRFIRGHSFKEAIDRYHEARKLGQSGGESLVLRGLIGRFVDVCDAMDYAHSRGILHRDLKPANIMLGKYGETLIVDWGLARMHASQKVAAIEIDEGPVRPFSVVQGQETQWGSAIGTPHFMSPEQAAGRLDLLGPTSDIFSLGATLFYVLTGETHVCGDSLGELLQKVQHGEVADVRLRNADIDEALGAICRKAMAKQPGDRYPRVAELARDLEHWLGDEPVVAMTETWRHRFGRWVRRHHTTAALVAIAGLMLLSVLSVSLVLIFAAQRREAQAHARAEKSFLAARQAVDRYFTRVSEATLLNQPGLQPLRKDLLENAMTYYQEFLRERGEDRALQGEAMNAAFNLGRIYEELGDFDQAKKFYQQASQGQHALLKALPSDLHRVEMLSDTLAAQGRLAQKQSALTESLRYNREAQQLRERLVAAAPERWEYQRKLANCLMNEGICYLRSQDLPRAANALRQAQSLRAPWAGSEGVVAIRRDFAKGHYNLGVYEAQSGDPSAAQRELELAAELAEELVRVNPLDLELKLLISTCYRMIGDSWAGGTDPMQSIAHYERAIAALTSLVQRNPEVSEYQLGLAGLYMNLSQVHVRDSEALAKEALDAAITILDSQVQENASPTALRDLALALRERGDLMTASPDEQAIEDLQRSVSILAALAEDFPDNADFTAVLKTSRELLQSRQEMQARSKFR
jgi:eukaryotic-like serine/threonine-protein kinase